MDLQTRIANFEKMAEDDPDNELGHFSLGKAYLEAGQHERAAACFRRVIEINPQFSKAYHLLAEAQQALGDRDGAVETLTRGYVVAHNRGDMKPREEMASLLRSLGAEPPAIEAAGGGPAAVAAEPGTAGGFRCRRCGAPGPRLSSPPMRGDLGQQVFEHICASCWREWIGMGTKVINELRLDLRDEAAQDVYDHYMKEFLGLS